MVDGVAGRLGERAAQDEILRGVSGEGHLGERHQVGAAVRSALRPSADQVRIGFKISYYGVDLGKRDTQLGHGWSLERPVDVYPHASWPAPACS